ncbi:MAG: ATP synthase F0 subunit B [Thermodesulfobacteriota bacterium]
MMRWLKYIQRPGLMACLLLLGGLFFFGPALNPIAEKIGLATPALASGPEKEEGHGGEEQAPGLIEINASLLIQVANFIILLIVLNAVLYRPIRKIIKERQEKFSGLEFEIGSLNERAEQRVKEIDVRLSEAKREGFTQKDGLKGRGLEEEKKIIGEASGRADQDIQKIKELIVKDVAAARASLQAELAVFSKELAQKVLGRSL